jgi:hypothetical protein
VGSSPTLGTTIYSLKNIMDWISILLGITIGGLLAFYKKRNH